jgi:hypothetical protein
MILPQKYEYSKLIQRRENTSISSLSYDTRFKFSNLLKTIIETEKNVELFRKLLNSNVFFNSIQSFNLIKPKYRDNITITDIQHFFRENSVIIPGAEVELLFRRLDKNRDGIVGCQEVMNSYKISSFKKSFLKANQIIEIRVMNHYLIKPIYLFNYSHYQQNHSKKRKHYVII